MTPADNAPGIARFTPRRSGGTPTPDRLGLAVGLPIEPGWSAPECAVTSFSIGEMAVLHFLVAVTVHLTDEGQPSLELLVPMSRQHRELLLASEHYPPNHEWDLRVQELRHAALVLLAVSEGDFMIPDYESPWEDWDGDKPVSARTPVGPDGEGRDGGSAEPPHSPPPEAATDEAPTHAADS